MFFSKKSESFFDHFSPRQAFFGGLIFGFLAICTIGFLALATMTLSQEKTNSPKAANNNAANQVAQPSNNQAADLAKNLKPLTNQDHFRGDKTAPVKLVEFSDFQCPYCQRAHATLEQLVDDYQGEVAWVYKHFPLESLHPYAFQAAEASECAAEQGKFWEYADTLYANQSLITPDYLKTAAGNIGLDQKDFNDCLTSGRYQGKVEDNFSEGEAAGITGTPGIYVNDILIKGALPIEQFKQAIDSLLN